MTSAVTQLKYSHNLTGRLALIAMGHSHGAYPVPERSETLLCTVSEGKRCNMLRSFWISMKIIYIYTYIFFLIQGV